MVPRIIYKSLRLPIHYVEYNYSYLGVVAPLYSTFVVLSFVLYIVTYVTVHFVTFSELHNLQINLWNVRAVFFLKFYIKKIFPCFLPNFKLWWVKWVKQGIFEFRISRNDRVSNFSSFRFSRKAKWKNFADKNGEISNIFNRNRRNRQNENNFRVIHSLSSRYSDHIDISCNRWRDIFLCVLYAREAAKEFFLVVRPLRRGRGRG